jgi:tryptophan halogenase
MPVQVAGRNRSERMGDSADTRIRDIVIVGGGTAGWMTAALLSRALGAQAKIRLVESDEIGTVGVGESTIPSIRLVNAFLGLDEDDLLRSVQGTIKLGIQFNDWHRVGESYLHVFGDIGLPLGRLPFHACWLRTRQDPAAPDLWAYSLNARAIGAHRFARMERVGDTPLAGLRWAYHLDAGRYARYLRRHAAQGVQRTEGKVVKVNLRATDGFIESVQLASGETIAGDLFIDCSGFRGLLIEDALRTGYEDWRHWLPCDRAMVAPGSRVEPLRPFTQASARPAGWQWRIPLQHRSGNGHVYCSQFMGDDEASALLVGDIEGELLEPPRLLRFTSGMRRQSWNRNCVALGLAAGFMEPLESTGIHLIQSGVQRLLALFPDRHCDAALATEYNRQTRFEYERIRDFLILHYRAIERRDTPFWRHCAQITMPEPLERKLALFRGAGRIVRDADELFAEPAWLQVMLGQGIVPAGHHPLADALPRAQLDESLAHIRKLLERAVAGMPGHAQFIARHCAAATTMEMV